MPNQLLIMDVNGVQPLEDIAFQRVIREIIHLKDVNGDPEVGVTVATGYTYPTLKKLLGYAPSAPMVLENGGNITDIGGNALVYHPLTADEIDMTRPLLKYRGIHYAGFNPKGSSDLYYLVISSAAERELIEKYKVISTQLTSSADDFLARCLVLGACQIFLKAVPGARLPPSGFNSLNHQFSARSSMYGILHQNIDKGIGVLELMKLLGVPPEGVVLVGDDYNDIPMFQKVPAPIKIPVGKKCPQEMRWLGTCELLHSPKTLTAQLKEIFLLASAR